MKRLFGCVTGALAVALLLQGCSAIAPGFDAVSRSDFPASANAQVAASGVDSDQPPEGAITAITPDLIRAQKSDQPKAVSEQVRALIGMVGPYQIGPGDVIAIVVYDHPELVFSAIPATTVADPASVSPAPGFIVSDTGQLTFPYAGPLHVSGMTIQQLEDTLARRLARVYKNPQLSVRVTAFRSKRAYVEGEVGKPGLQVFTDIPMTLPEALNRAGGITPAGDRSFVTLTRKGVTTTIDLMALAEAGIDPTQIPLQNGDMVTVRNRDERKVSVMGEVVQPSSILMYNGRLSLNDALSQVGGVNLGTANPRQIYVIRNKPDGGQAVFHLDARTPTALALADGFALKAKDVVYVDPVALVAWTRLVNLILPSATTVSTIRQTR